MTKYRKFLIEHNWQRYERAATIAAGLSEGISMVELRNDERGEIISDIDDLGSNWLMSIEEVT